MGQFKSYLAGRLAGWLFLASGIVTVANNYLPGAEHLDKAVLNLLGLSAIGLAGLMFVLPWHRWPARATLAVIPAALALVMLGNMFGGVSAYSYAVYFVLIFAWVGVTQPPLTPVFLTPIVTAAYVLPGFLREDLPAGSVSSVTVAIPVCLLVGETIARTIRRAERLAAAAQEAEQRFRLAFDDAPIGMALVAPDGRFLRVNGALCEIVGYDADDLLDRSFQDITHPDDLEADLGHLGEMLAGSRTRYSMEKRYLRADGEIVWVSLSVSLVRHPGGDPRYFVSQIEDITGRRRDDEQLRHGKQVLERTQALARVGSWEWEAATGPECIRWSAEMYRLHGVEPESFVLSADNVARLVHPADRAEWCERLKHAASSGAGLEGFAYRTVQPADSPRWMWIQGGFEPERPGMMLGFAQDITDTVRTRQVLEEARDAAQAAAHTKARFLANMSHEIRTPLNAIVGLTSLLRNEGLEPQTSGYLRMIQASAEHLLSVVNDVLDFSKIEAGAVELDEMPMDVRAVTRDAIALVAHAAEAKSLEIICDLDDRVPATVVGDGGRVRQVLTNLLSNAIKFTSEGRVTLRVRFEPAGVPAVEFAVEDTGIGIPPDGLARLFQPFSQLDATTTRLYGGTGLGLAISRYLVERMGGRLSVESEEGGGSVFGFTLPLPGMAQIADGAEPVPGTADEVIPGGDQAPPEDLGRTHPLRILVAEDDLANRLVAAALLEHLGYRADVVCDGRQAIDAARTGAYDVAFLDIQMPNVDGLTAGREIVAALGPARPRLVALTGNATEHDRRACLDAGFDDYLTKPITVARLAAMLEQVPALSS